MTDRDLHKEVAIAETGVKEYTAYVKIGYQCLSDVMILDANDFEVGIMTIPFSMLISISNHYYHLIFPYTGSFNIQSCFVLTNNPNLLVQCTFFINSTATGFVVVENGEESFNKILHKLPDDSDKGSVNITGLPAGEYSVRVYDSKIELINDMEPAYEHFQSIHIMVFTSPSLETVLSTATHSLHNSSEQVINSHSPLKTVFLLHIAILYTLADVTPLSPVPSPSPVYSPSPVHSPAESINSNTIILATSITTGLLILLVILIVITCMAVAIRKKKNTRSNKNSK